MRNDTERAAEIAARNDALRRVHAGGRVFVTRAVSELPYAGEVLAAVAAFDAFTADNDPYGEHDFGSMALHGERFCWKIDYMDEEEHWCDPLDPACIRVLIVMLASEY